MSHTVCHLGLGYLLIVIHVFTVESYTLNETLAVLKETVNLTEEEWSHAVTNSVLSRMEENLKYYERNIWLFDVRAAFQIFLTKLNLKAALESPRMELYDTSKLTALKSKRLENIVRRADHLNDLFRFRLLARVPRRNQTRMVAAIFAFTEVAWLNFLPPMDSGDENEELITVVEKKFKRNFFPTPPPSTSYSSHVLINQGDLALNITETCVQELTVNLEDQALLNGAVLQNTTVPASKCYFTTHSNRKMCRNFVENGVKNTTAGYEILFRLALLTAARLARNCYVINEYKDRVIRNYLCLMARLEVDRFNPGTRPDILKQPGECQKDLLTIHDYATLCLLNGDQKFMHKRLMDCTQYCSAQWNGVGCFGHSQSGQADNFTTPLPYWVAVRGPESDNKFCFRRLTASCLSHHAGVIRGLVEIGDVTGTQGNTTGDGDGGQFDEGPTTEDDYGYE